MKLSNIFSAVTSKIKNSRDFVLGFKDLFSSVKLPSNILVTVTHGSARVPLKVFRHLSIYYQTSPRLLLNFSDYGTKYLVDKVPNTQKVVPKYGRIIGDPNRNITAPDIIRFEDFGGNKVFREKFEKKLTSSIFRFFWKRKLLNYSYYPYYKEIYKHIEGMVKDIENENKPIILVDIHDVGNRILGRREKEDRERKSKITKVVISNAPNEETGEESFGTAPDYFMKSFAEILAKNLEIETKEVKINNPYKGGNIIRQFGNPYYNLRLRRILNGKQIFAIQVEFNRGLYLNEVNQRPYRNKIRFVRNALMKTLKQLCEFEV
jgi:hypothetical protein